MTAIVNSQSSHCVPLTDTATHHRKKVTWSKPLIKATVLPKKQEPPTEVESASTGNQDKSWLHQLDHQCASYFLGPDLMNALDAGSKSNNKIESIPAAVASNRSSMRHGKYSSPMLYGGHLDGMPRTDAQVNCWSLLIQSQNGKLTFHVDLHDDMHPLTFDEQSIVDFIESVIVYSPCLRSVFCVFINTHCNYNRPLSPYETLDLIDNLKRDNDYERQLVSPWGHVVCDK
jgi:hypothetical protein